MPKRLRAESIEYRIIYVELWIFDDVDNAQRIRLAKTDCEDETKWIAPWPGDRHEFNRFCSAMNTGNPLPLIRIFKEFAQGGRRGRARESLDHQGEAPYLHSITLLIMMDIMASIVKLVC